MSTSKLELLTPRNSQVIFDYVYTMVHKAPERVAHGLTIAPVSAKAEA